MPSEGIQNPDTGNPGVNLYIQYVCGNGVIEFVKGASQQTEIETGLVFCPTEVG